MYKLIVTRKFEKDIKEVPPKIKLKTELVVQKLRENPFTQELNIKKLKGFDEKYWRVKVAQSWRLIYIVEKNIIYLLRIKHRRDIYRISF